MSDKQKTKPKKKSSETKNSEVNKEQIDAITQQANSVFQKLPLLGPITWLYGQSKGHKNYFIDDLNWLTLPPLINNQYKLYLKKDAPISYICWAKISDEVADRIKKSNQIRLATNEWNCGDNIWIIDVVAPFGGIENTIKDVRDNVFPGQEVNMYIPAMPNQGDGKVVTFKTPDAGTDNKEKPKH